MVTHSTVIMGISWRAQCQTCAQPYASEVDISVCHGVFPKKSLLSKSVFHSHPHCSSCCLILRGPSQRVLVFVSYKPPIFGFYVQPVVKPIIFTAWKKWFYFASFAQIPPIFTFLPFVVLMGHYLPNTYFWDKLPQFFFEIQKGNFIPNANMG